MKTADELVAEGEQLHKRGSLIVLLLPSQEWMAVKLQLPFFRYKKLPIDGSIKITSFSY